MNLVKLGTSRWGSALLAALCKGLPRASAYSLADGFAEQIAVQPDLGMNLGLRSNLSVVLARPPDHPAVEETLLRLYTNTLRGYVDLFSILPDSGEDLERMIQLDEVILDTIRGTLEQGSGVLMVGAHTCGFDLLMLALAKAFPGMQALTDAQPAGGMLLMNELRIKFGLDVTPITSASLRKAIRSLRRGGVVAIAADLPDPRGDELLFFEQPCSLPVGHARLAASTGARIVVGLSHRAGDGIYVGEGELCDPPRSKAHSKAARVSALAQRCVSFIEDFIRLRPDQWFMPHPLWARSQGVRPAGCS